MSPEIIASIEKTDARIYASTTFAYIAKRYSLKEKRVLDIGCGYGGYMQRFGAQSVGITTRAEEVAYGRIKGRDIRIGNAEHLYEVLHEGETFDVIWCNNILEHLLSPHTFLMQLKKFAHADTVLIIGTPVIPALSILTRLQKFRGALASVHINFFNYVTYPTTIRYAGWNIREVRSFFFKNTALDYVTHFFAPHLYVIAENNTIFTYPPKKVTEWEEDARFKSLLDIGTSIHTTSTMSGKTPNG